VLTIISKTESKKVGQERGISTRRLCEQSFNSRNYGMRMIQKALNYGYIKRVKTGKEIISLLTPKGRRLLDKLEKEE
jgi:ribosomal protein S19E (S16A)